MNERIKQLMSVAFDTVSGDDKQWCIKYSEKFAELIMKECIEVIDYNDLVGNNTEYYGKKIKEHFGVEE